MCQQISIIRYLQRLRGNTQTDRQTHTHKPTTITLRLRAQVNKNKCIISKINVIILIAILIITEVKHLCGQYFPYLTCSSTVPVDCVL